MDGRLMQGDLPRGTRAFIVVGPLAGAALLILVVFLGERRDEAPGSNAGEDAATQGDIPVTASSPASGGTLLAPFGFVPRNLDTFESPALHLGLVDLDGAGTLCTIGGGTNAAAPLAMARCRRASPEELRRPVPRSITESRLLGDAMYHIGTNGDLVVARGASTRRVTAMPAEPDAIHVCQAGTTRVVAVDGNLVHGVRHTAVTFIDASAPATPDVPTAALLVETHVYTYHLACRREEARLTWLEAAVEGETPIIVVEQVVCTPEGCQTIQTRLPRLGRDAVVASIAGQVLLVSVGDGGTRIRLAPITEIGSAPELDVPSDGDLPVLARTLHARGGAAIITLRTSDGLRALRVDTTGEVRPLPVIGDSPGLR